MALGALGAVRWHNRAALCVGAQETRGDAEPCAVAARNAARRKAAQADAAGALERELAVQAAQVADFEGPDMREAIQDRVRPLAGCGRRQALPAGPGLC
jgi:hypothetical protein